MSGEAPLIHMPLHWISEKNCIQRFLHKHNTRLSTEISLHIDINSSPPSAAYMHRWTGSSLVQAMACRLFGTKPLPEPMLAYCQLDSQEQISVKFESEFYHFHSRKFIWKYCLPNGGHLSGRYELKAMKYHKHAGLWFKDVMKPKISCAIVIKGI